MKDNEPNPPIRTALLSVSDKAGLADFASRLAAMGVRLVSTGGTARALREAGLAVVDVSDLTGFPEIMDGRVKTLHPAIHGGLLAVRGNRSHDEARAAHNIGCIDLAVINLYPFEAARARRAGYQETVENIDIGGPALIRAAAKNHDAVTILVDPGDYDAVLDEMNGNDGATSPNLRRTLAQKAYARTAAYDTMIAGWLLEETGGDMPGYATFGGARALTPRYGENPHQTAAFYRTGEARPGVATAKIVQGKPLSYNNLNDTDAAFECVAELGTAQPAVAIIKHANPCGVAVGDSLAAAYEKARACDPVSAFGGIIALNGTLDAETAEAITGIFTEVVIAPEAKDEALAVFAKKPNLRLLLTGALPDPSAAGLTARTLAGGLLVQSRDTATVGEMTLKTVTKRAPTDQELQDMRLAFQIAKHVKSNAIVYVKDGASVGIGAGQMSRIDSARIAARKAADAAAAIKADQPLTVGSVVASDAFFPFADGLMVAVEAGATAVIQPGGSIRDDAVIAAADEAGIAMVFTGTRHFRH